MNKLVLIAITAMFLTSCATAKLTTDIGARIGQTYHEAALKGRITADQSIQAWPYISGQIKGIMSNDFDLDLSQRASIIIKDLDKLAKKETLTDEEKGFVVGSIVRLEVVSLKEGWSQYGVTIFDLFTKFIGG